MTQKAIGVDQIASGKDGVMNLGERLNTQDTALTQAQTDLNTVITANETEIARINEAVMAMSSAPVTTPVFNDVETYAVQAADLTAGMATTVTIPNGKSYKVGKGNLMVLRNNVIQRGSFAEASETTVSFDADYLLEGDELTFIIGKPTKLDYNTAITYYAGGPDEGKIETVTYTGDIERAITYTYTAEGKINAETIVEDGITTTKTYTYSGGKITGIHAVVA